MRFGRGLGGVAVGGHRGAAVEHGKVPRAPTPRNFCCSPGRRAGNGPSTSARELCQSPGSQEKEEVSREALQNTRHLYLKVFLR
ncbi:Hypothetical protein AA314_09007 [Archangium gephyra]|uniref:Uncharacterized protein n=1 Tax=Archangium gephyra TaxID=48 RepID=A0AAC8TK07_9BACT|nr:Hypothetical protein AA314_09007 [Archangium gephyra]